MPNPTYVLLDMKQRLPIPNEFLNDDNRYSESLVEYFLELYTKPGDRVIDIFAGLGTTLLVAEEMGRIPYGIELTQSKHDFILSKLANKENLILGDSKNLDDFDLPSMDFAICSPPYTRRESASDPLTAYQELGTYQKYLDELGVVFKKLSTIMKPGAFVVVEVANLKGNLITTLAWDVARSLSKVLLFEGEVIICWRGTRTEEGIYGSGYDHSYCLVFRNSYE
jgi:DNA modification methylase